MIFEQRRRSFKTTQNPNWENFKISDRKLRRFKRLLSLGNSKLYISKRLKVSHVKRSITLFIELKSETLWNKDFLLYYIT